MMCFMARSTKLGAALDYAVAHHHLLPTHVMRSEGLTGEEIAELRRDGVIERIIRGLYRQRGTRTPIQDIAATLHRHAGAVASHTSALHLHGLDVAPPRRPHFTLPPGSTGSTTLGELHRSPLEPVDVTARRRLPVTTVARSIVDSAEQLSVERLAAVVAEAVTSRAVTIRAIAEAAARVERAPGRLGSGRLRSVLASWTDDILPDSVAEAAAIRRIVDFGLPAPVTQHEVIDVDGTFVARLDMAWPEHRVAREYDSDRHHAPERTEADERRRQRLEELGWSIASVHRKHLMPSSTQWLEKLAAALRERRYPTAS